MTSKYAELSEEVKKSVVARLREPGVTLTASHRESFVPPRIEKP